MPPPAVPKPPEPAHAPEKNLRRTVVVSFALVIVFVTAFGGVALAAGSNAPLSVAVLPLKNLSTEPANDLFADGLTGEIIRDLSMIEGLTVRSETSSFAFKEAAAYPRSGSTTRRGVYRRRAPCSVPEGNYASVQ